jgi:hypothetical protein
MFRNSSSGELLMVTLSLFVLSIVSSVCSMIFWGLVIRESEIELGKKKSFRYKSAALTLVIGFAVFGLGILLLIWGVARNMPR